MEINDKKSFKRLAFELYDKTLTKKIKFDSALADLESEIELTRTERSHLLFYTLGALRYRGRTELFIRKFSNGEPPELERLFLEIAGFSILYADSIPLPALVSEWVEVSKQIFGPKPTGFFNFVLRRLSEEPQRKAFRDEATATGLLGKFSPWDWFSFPEWAWNRLRLENSETWIREFAGSALLEPTTWVRNLNKSEPRMFVYQGEELDDNQIIQGLSSQTISDEAYEISSRELGPEFSILDLCAAPGGKAITMAGLGVKRVVATDQNPRRLRRVAENCERTKSAIEIMNYKDVVSSSEKYDLVWIDAPCMAFGTLQKNPEAKWNRGEADMVEISRLQGELLRIGAEKTKKYILYTVCSPFKEEGQEIIDRAGITVKKRWFISPQDPPNGEGFQGFLGLSG